jgi:prevent-host-death family protein
MNTQQSDVIDAAMARERFSDLLERVERGEHFTITRDGLPIARLVPVVRSRHTSAERRAAIERVKTLSKGLSLGGASVRDLIADGRR